MGLLLDPWHSGWGAVVALATQNAGLSASGEAVSLGVRVFGECIRQGLVLSCGLCLL